jgi:hypothetical protein
MKKNIIVFLIIFLSVSAAFCAEENRFPPEWALLGVDAAIAGLTIYALLDQISAAEAYNKLGASGEIDGDTEAGYYRLLYEREKVIGKENIVIVSSAALGAALLFTAADYFWLHKFFPVDIKASLLPEGNGIKFAINRGF